MGSFESGLKKSPSGHSNWSSSMQGGLDGELKPQFSKRRSSKATTSWCGGCVVVGEGGGSSCTSEQEFQREFEICSLVSF